MGGSVLRYVLNHLSVLTDEQIKTLAFDSVDMNELTQEDGAELKTLFLKIQKQLPLAHHGILGMKWGVRRYQNKDGTLTSAGEQRLADDTAKQSIFGTNTRFQIKTREGEVITAEPLKPSSTGKKIINTLLGLPEKDAMGSRGDANYTLNNSKGEKIGELSLISKNANTTYWDWITIDDSQRGKGYATDIINTLFTKAQEAGYSKVEINALKKPRPLYERLGFTYTDTSTMSIMDRINSHEFGAKHMEYDLTKLRHSRNNILSHHGILGMKWGVRRTDAQLARGSTRKSSGDDDPRSMSDDRLRNRINRLQMEKQYKQLTKELDSSSVSKGKEYVGNALKVIGTAAAASTAIITLYNNTKAIRGFLKK